MKIIIITVLFFINHLESKILYLDDQSKGEVLLKNNFITSLSFDSNIKTVFLGDTENFKTEISGNKKIIAIWSTGKLDQSNLVIVTEEKQYNLILSKSNSSPLFYNIKTKPKLKKSEIIKKTVIKDRDLIDALAKEKKTTDIILTFKDKEYFKDTLLINIRIVIENKGKNEFIIIPEQIILSQTNLIMPIIYKYFNKSSHILSITAELKEVNTKIRVQIPFQKGNKICQREIYI